MEVEHGDAGSFAEDAVRLAAGEAQLIEAILELGHCFAAGAVLQGRIGIGRRGRRRGRRGSRGGGGHDGHSGHGLNGRIDRRQLDHLDDLVEAVVGAQAVHQHVVACQTQVKHADHGGIIRKSHLAVVAALGYYASELVDQAQHAGIRQHRHDVVIGNHALDHRGNDRQHRGLHGVYVVGIHCGLASGLVVYAVIQVAVIGRLAISQLVAQQPPGFAGLGAKLQAFAVRLLGFKRVEQVILGLRIERAGNQRASRQVEHAVDVQAGSDFTLDVQAFERGAQGCLRKGKGRHVACRDVQLIGRDLNRLEQAGVVRIQEIDLRVLLHIHRLAVDLIGNQGRLRVVAQQGINVQPAGRLFLRRSRPVVDGCLIQLSHDLAGRTGTFTLHAELVEHAVVDIVGKRDSIADLLGDGAAQTGQRKNDCQNERQVLGKLFHPSSPSFAPLTQGSERWFLKKPVFLQIFCGRPLRGAWSAL